MHRIDFKKKKKKLCKLCPNTTLSNGVIVCICIPCSVGWKFQEPNEFIDHFWNLSVPRQILFPFLGWYVLRTDTVNSKIHTVIIIEPFAVPKATVIKHVLSISANRLKKKKILIIRKRKEHATDKEDNVCLFNFSIPNGQLTIHTTLFFIKLD